MKKTMLFAAFVATLSLGVYYTYTQNPTSPVSSALPTEVAKVPERVSEVSLDKLFSLYTKKDVSFNKKIGANNLENTKALALPSVEMARKTAHEFLQNCDDAYKSLETDLRHSVELQKEEVILGKINQNEIVLAPLKTYANSIQKNVKDAYKKIFLQEDPYHFEVILAEENMFSFHGMELLTLLIQAFDQVGVDLSINVSMLQLVVPDQDPKRIIQLGLPVMKYTGKIFEEMVVTPDPELAKSVHALLPKTWVNDIPYLRLRTLQESVPGAYTPTDKNYVVYYNKQDLYRQAHALLDIPTNPFPFATLSKVAQEKVMYKIVQMLFFHEQVHSMTKKVIAALPKDPSCKDCEEKKFGIIEMIAFLVTFQHFEDVETRHVIMRIIAKMSYSDYKLTQEKFLTPMLNTAVDKDKKDTCVRGKEIHVDCVFTNKLLTKEVVGDAVKKAVAYGEEELKKDFLPLSQI